MLTRQERLVESRTPGTLRRTSLRFVGLVARLSGAFERLSPRARNFLAYGLALAIVFVVAYGISLGQVLGALRRANLYLFLPARILSFLCFFFGETLLYSRLFSYFNAPISYSEMLPANAAQYFLQVVNAAVAGGALVAFIHRRKKVPWLAAGCTMIFQTLIDFQLMAWMALFGTVLVPSFPYKVAWYYPAMVIVVLWAFAGFWRLGPTRWRLLRWFYERPSWDSFRKARLRHYLTLGAIRAPIFLVQGVSFYLQMVAFNIHVPLAQVLAATPSIMILTALPIVPVGLGADQAVMVHGFRGYGSKADLLAMSLASNAMGIVFRLLLGLTSAGTFAKELAEQANKGPYTGEVELDRGDANWLYATEVNRKEE